MTSAYDKMDAAAREVQKRMKHATGEVLDAEIAYAAVQKAVASSFNIGDIDLEEFRILSGLTPLPLRDFLPREDKQQFSLHGRKVSTAEALEWQSRQLEPKPPRKITINLPDENFNPAHLGLVSDILNQAIEGSTVSTISMDPLDPDLNESQESIQIKPQKTDLVPLGDTAVTIREGGAYRSPGKQPIVSLLAEAGLTYSTVVTVTHPDGAANLTPAQLGLVSKLNAEHGNITFFHELAKPVNLVVSFPQKEKKLGLFRRFWRSLSCRFGLAAIELKE